jgi:hypothetical protein
MEEIGNTCKNLIGKPQEKKQFIYQGADVTKMELFGGTAC